MAKPVKHDSVTTTSESGKRIKINPVPVTGKWKNRRLVFQWALIVGYLAVPWIKIQGHPLLLLDIQNRRFSIFGQLFFAHEVPNLLFVALGFMLWVALVTALFGRVWCGWACPQTVFIENIFRKIEIWIEGDLGQKKNTGNSVLKWSIFTVISILMAHSFLAYFVGSQESLKMMTRSPSENWGAFLSVCIMTGVVLFDFAWFREQFCLIACPYGRFQSVMLDPASLTVTYDKNRSDCIDCFKCVRVCPTGIDIRNGMQIECIGCTACMDACDSIMDKVNKPRNLISYKSEITMAGKKNPWIRSRTVIYATLFLVMMAGLTYRLKHREVLQEDIVRATDAPYQIVKDADGKPWIINHFKVRAYNMGWHTSSAQLFLSKDAENSGIVLATGGTSSEKINVDSGKTAEIQFFLKTPKELFDADTTPKTSVVIHWEGEQSLDKVEEVKLIGPNVSI